MAEKSELYDALKTAEKRIDALNAQIRRLHKKVDMLTKKNEEMWYENKLQMSKIVEYRRLIEHYEDGAPLYVQRDG